MNKEDFDSKMSRLVTEKKLLLESVKRSDDLKTKNKIKKRIIHLNGEILRLKKEYNINKEILDEIEQVIFWNKL